MLDKLSDIMRTVKRFSPTPAHKPAALYGNRNPGAPLPR